MDIGNIIPSESSGGEGSLGFSAEFAVAAMLGAEGCLDEGMNVFSAGRKGTTDCVGRDLCNKENIVGD